PRDEVGEPLARFLALENPPPQPAAADATLSFAIAPEASLRSRVWVAPLWRTGEGDPVLVAANGRSVVVEKADGELDFPGGSSAAAPSPDGAGAAGLDYDFRTGLVLARGGGRAERRRDRRALWRVGRGHRHRRRSRSRGRAHERFTGRPPQQWRSHVREAAALRKRERRSRLRLGRPGRGGCSRCHLPP